MQLSEEYASADCKQEHGSVRRMLPNLLAFVIGLSLAWFLKWETGDLVWSLWLCSLVVGYLTLLSAIAGGAYVGWHTIRNVEFEKKHRMPAICGGIALALFFLGFFSLHFCGFHAGHSVFLSHLFPVDGMPADGFGRAFNNPALLWILAVRHLMAPYGLFLLPALLAERRHVFGPLIRAVRSVRDGASGDGAAAGDRKSHTKVFADAMGRPYLNVMRMHLLIFFFAIAHFMKFDSFVVYAVVYFVYFFPWGEFKNPARNAK